MDVTEVAPTLTLKALVVEDGRGLAETLLGRLPVMEKLIRLVDRHGELQNGRVQAAADARAQPLVVKLILIVQVRRVTPTRVYKAT